MLIFLSLCVSLLPCALIVSEPLFHSLQKKVLGKSFRHRICELLPQCKSPAGSIVICGDSRAQRHVNARLLSALSGLPCVNLGVESGDLTVCCSIFREFPEVLNNGKNLVVISMSPFQANDGALKLGYQSAASFVEMPFADRIRLYYSSLAGLWDMYVGIYREQAEITRDAGAGCCGRHRGTFDSTRGFLGIEDIAWDGTIGANYAIPGCPWYRQPHIHGVRWVQIRRIVEKMGKMPTRFIFYAPPVSQVYRKYLHTTVGFAMDSTFNANMESLVGPFSTMKFIDFYSDTTLCIPDSLFYDPAHLNARGAVEFTRILHNRIMAWIGSGLGKG